MNYENLNNVGFLPKNINRKFFMTNKSDLLFRFNIQMARCEDINKANSLVSFVENSQLFFLTKNDSVRQPIGVTLSSYFCSFDVLQSCNELQKILKYSDSCGFKGHNAKGLKFNVIVRTPYELNIQTKRKVDLFINLHPTFFKNISRRIQHNKYRYNIDRDYYDFGVNNNSTNPVEFDRNKINFRFFRSTLNFETIISTIEMCKLLIEFCQNDISLDCLLTDDESAIGIFNDYISENSKYFKFYIQRKNIALKSQQTFFGNEDLTNGLVDCSDVHLEQIEAVDEEKDTWKFFKYNPIFTIKNLVNDSVAILEQALISNSNSIPF